LLDGFVEFTYTGKTCLVAYVIIDTVQYGIHLGGRCDIFIVNDRGVAGGGLPEGNGLLKVDSLMLGVIGFII
jgi:hypothetical protein